MFNIEVASGMAGPETIQAATDRLEKKGVKRIVVVPLSISSYSPIIENTTLILGLRKEMKTSQKESSFIKSNAAFVMTSAIDSHPLIAERLKGLDYIYNGKTLLPHENITKWIESSVMDVLKE